MFGFKKRKDDKLEQSAEVTKTMSDKKRVAKPRVAKSAKVLEVTKKDASLADKTVVAAPKAQIGVQSHLAAVILRPRITEKSGVLSQGGVYTFEVTKTANKMTIAKAVAALYKVTPVKVTVINTPMRNVFIKGRRGTVAGVRKALVTVKKGDKIDFV